MSDPRAPVWRRYLRFWGADIGADVDDELAFHLELRIAELVASGLSPAAAREEALRRLGDVNRLKQTCRVIGEERETSARRREWVNAIWSDARVGVRQFARTPVLAFVAIITLALGLGANTAIFSVVYAVLLRPLPYADADRITVITETQRGSDTGVGPGQFTEWVKRNRAFEAVAARNWTTFNLGDGGDPQRVVAAFVSPSFFKVQYAAPEVGRYFNPDEADPANAHVVVLSYALFVQRFAGDRTVVGRTIRLNDEAYRVVGVAPRDYVLTSGAEALWVPLALTSDMQTTFDDHWLRVVGKLRPGVTPHAAQQDMERVSREIADLHGDAMADRSARVYAFRDDLTHDYSRQLTVLFGAVGFVLLLACLNVANMLLARVNVRRKEIAIRAAIGASRARIVLQFLIESLVLAGAGAIAALIVAWVVLPILLRIAPAQLPQIEHAATDAHALIFLAAATLASGVLLGLLPALRGSGGDLQRVLREGGKSSSMGSTRDRLRGTLVVAEVALSLVLLTGAGLSVRSAGRLHRIDPGFDTANLLTLRFALPAAKYNSPERVIGTYAQVVERLRALPHVRAVELNSSIPLEGPSVDVEVHAEGRVDKPGQEPFGHFRLVTPTYFQTMRIPIVRGRSLQESDRAHALPVVVINETLARGVWPDQDPIGKRFYCCSDDSLHIWRTVVGVSANVRHWLKEAPPPEIYVPYVQSPANSWSWFANSLAVLIRTDGSAANVLPAVRRTIATIDPTLPLFDIQSYDDIVARATAGNRFSLQLLSSLALLALILAAVGIYGVLAYFVSQRKEEISVRVALGARTGDVIGLVLRQGGKLVGAGIVIGLALALATSRALDTLLYDVSPTDPLTYMVVSLTLGGIALLSCWIPARRAAALDPADTLRS